MYGLGGDWDVVVVGGVVGEGEGVIYLLRWAVIWFAVLWIAVLGSSRVVSATDEKDVNMKGYEMGRTEVRICVR
jgi:hypothetical protein